MAISGQCLFLAMPISGVQVAVAISGGTGRSGYFRGVQVAVAISGGTDCNGYFRSTGRNGYFRGYRLQWLFQEYRSQWLFQGVQIAVAISLNGYFRGTAWSQWLFQGVQIAMAISWGTDCNGYFRGAGYSGYFRGAGYSGYFRRPFKPPPEGLTLGLMGSNAHAQKC